MDCDDEEVIYWQRFGGKHYTETDDSIAEKEFKELQDIRMWLYEIAGGKTTFNSDDRDMANRILDYLRG